MSWDIDIIDHETGRPRTLDAVHHFTGGTYAIGGTNQARLNVTYNYSPLYAEVWEGRDIQKLDGKTVGQAKPLLEAAVRHLGIDADDNYWEPTPGNAGAAARDLLELCNLCDDRDSIMKTRGHSSIEAPVLQAGGSRFDSADQFYGQKTLKTDVPKEPWVRIPCPQTCRIAPKW